MGKHLRIFVSLTFFSFAILLTAQAWAQDLALVAPTSVPHLVQYAGTVTNSLGEPVTVKFALYAAQTGGEPVWSESQAVTTDAKGRYSVLLGSATEGGLPQPVFSSAEAKWLGITVGDGAEASRTILVATPYSLKASDAETLGGHPATDFALIGKNAKSNTLTNITQISGSNGVLVNGTASTTATGPTVMLSLDGTYLGNLGAEYFAQIATANTFKGNQTINGNATINGALTVSGTIVSPFLDGIAATLPTLAGTNTFSGANTFSKPIISTVASGTAPFTIASTTAVPNLDASLLGGNAAAAYAQVAAGNIFTANQTLASNGTATASGGYDSLSLKLTASSYNSSTSAAVPQNFFWKAERTGNNTASPSGTLNLLYSTGSAVGAETGFQFGSNGVITFATGQTFPAADLESTLNGVYAQLGAANSFTAANTFSMPITFAGNQTFPGTITKVSASSPLTASTTSGAVTLGLNETALETTLDGLYPQLAATTNTFTGAGYFDSYVEANQANGAGFAAVLGFGTAGSIGAFGNSDSGYGVQGESTTGPGVYGFGGAATPPTVTGSFGVYGNGATGVYGTSTTGIGTKGISSAADNNGIVGDETGTGGYGVYAHATGAQDTSTRYQTVGVYGLAENGSGVLGVNTGPSATYTSYQTGFSPSVTGGVWGDTSSDGAGFQAGGLVGTADNNTAAFLINNSASETTVFASNNSTGGTGTVVPVITAMGAKGLCGMNSLGDVTCSGRLKTAVPVAGSDQKVEVYSVQSAENWFEDFGSAKLENGRVTVAIDPQFAGIVNTGVEYHVFLTPQGECEGLYIASKSASGFEVRELHHGSSSVSFDYRIVAKRAGHESERMADATQELHNMTARHDMMEARRMAAHPAKALPAENDGMPIAPSTHESPRPAPGVLAKPHNTGGRTTALVAPREMQSAQP